MISAHRKCDTLPEPDRLFISCADANGAGTSLTSALVFFCFFSCFFLFSFPVLLCSVLFVIFFFLCLFSTFSFLALTKLVSPKPTCKVDGQTRPPRRPFRLKVCCVQCIVGVTMAITSPSSWCSRGHRLPGKKKEKERERDGEHKADTLVIMQT